MAKEGFAAIRSALGAFLSLAFMAWILSLIGLAGLQRSCYDISTLGQATSGLSTGGESTSPFASNLALTGIRGLNRSLQCSDVYRYYWFMLAFELVTLIGLSVLAAVGLLAASALSWLAWLTVLTLLFIQGADTFLAIKDIPYGLGGRNYAYSRLCATGWIIIALANLALIFLLGWRPRKLRGGAGGPIKY
uniref:Pali-domain-containing protein n=1 Tax=Tetradesmus obliquus TaxID=3088 RepID=A0A383WE48_TETOB|eukprot:jgi/Sobl393_1/861/SZX75523.1